MYVHVLPGSHLSYCATDSSTLILISVLCVCMSMSSQDPISVTVLLIAVTSFWYQYCVYVCPFPSIHPSHVCPCPPRTPSQLMCYWYQLPHSDISTVCICVHVLPWPNLSYCATDSSYLTVISVLCVCMSMSSQDPISVTLLLIAVTSFWYQYCVYVCPCPPRTPSQLLCYW